MWIVFIGISIEDMLEIEFENPNFVTLLLKLLNVYEKKYILL